MRKTIVTLFILFLVLALPVSARAAPLRSEQPVVHTILFWSNGCSYCSQVLTNVLPTMQDRYNSRLSILLIELVTIEDVDNLYTLGSTLGLSLEYPNLPLLSQMLPKGLAFTSFDPNMLLVSQTSTATKATGMALAWGIMVFMVFAMILAIVMLLRAFQGKPIRKTSQWLDIAIPILSLIGLGAAIYLTYVEFTHVRALCGPVGDCNAVQSSPYAKLFGVVPIGLVGAIGYVAILFAWIWRRFRTDSLARIAGPAMFGMALFGTLFSIYLTYLELFVIHAVCIWCLSSAVIITLLMLLNLPSITQWLAISDEEE
jgi:uncharacterized membrane protein